MADSSHYDEDVVRKIAQTGDIKKLEYLSSTGVDIFKKDSLGKSAFDYVVEKDLSKGFALVNFRISSIKEHLNNITHHAKSIKAENEQLRKNNTIIFKDVGVSRSFLLIVQVALVSISMLLCACNAKSSDVHDVKYTDNKGNNEMSDKHITN